MNRRGFLGALVGLAAAPLLPKLPLGYSLAESGLIVPEASRIVRTLGSGGAAALTGIDFWGEAERSAVGIVKVLRKDGASVMEFPFNMAGGNVRWRADAPTIYADAQAPLIVHATAGTTIRLFWFDLEKSAFFCWSVTPKGERSDRISAKLGLEIVEAD
jgi:hypothetical protein